MNGIVTAVEKKPQKKREVGEASVLTQPGTYKDGVLYVNPKLLGCWRVWYKQERSNENYSAEPVVEYLEMDLLPSDMACLASSPGSSRRTAVWISAPVSVALLL